jgi:hypothetical protein
MKRKVKRVISLLTGSALLLLWCGVASAGTTGKLAGEVKDKQTGELLPGVNVVLEGTTIGSVTDANGRYYILLIAPGTYSVTASLIGYQTVKVSNVKVNVDLTTTVNFEISQQTLELGEKIEIVAERPLIQKDGVTTMQVTEAEVVENMVADDFKDVLTLNSGITTAPVRDGQTGEGQYFIRGSRSNEAGFLVDGLYVRDGITGGVGSEVNTSAIEELQVISGNFNAEYGNAMSGIVNIVTQEGGAKTAFEFRGYTDALFGKPSRDYTFDERDELIEKKGRMDTPNWGTYQGQFSLSGALPGSKAKIKYFASGEYYQTDGNIGAMQDEFARRGLAKLTFQPTRSIKLGLTGNFNNKDLQIYEHLFARLNPEGNDRIHTETTQGVLSWTHTLSNKAFYEIRVQRFSRFFYDRVKPDPLLYSILFLNATEDFALNGSDDPRFIRQEERVLQGKFDFTYQVNANHNLKAGVDYNRHRVWRNYAIIISEPTITFADHFKFYPVNAAAYVQDKMEFKDLVVNVGGRVDYWNPDTWEVKDPFRPRTGGIVAGKKRWMVSPRLGLAHPISDQANLHFSYGHFYQTPEFDKISQNRGLSTRGSLVDRLVGNGNLKPQKTTSFEVGWDQQITDFLALTVTGFYKDIEHLIGTDYYPTALPRAAAYYVNQDFANARGVELNLRTRRYHHFAGYFSYTLSRAEGNSSNPNALVLGFDEVPPREPVKRLVTLDWDRPHVFNFNLDFRYLKNEGPLVFGSRLLQNVGMNLTGRFQSGLPYTPTDSRGKPTAEENVAREPSTWQLDLRVDKLFEVAGMKLGVFTEVLNLTNRANITDVYTDTGLPFDNTNLTYTPQGQRDPYNVGQQRNIRLGLELLY